jgi:PhnB protein
MAVTLNPYINFQDQTRDAMTFYQSVFGGELRMSSFQEYQAAQDPADADKIMHAQLEGEGGLIFMASDTPSGMDYRPGTNFSMSLSGEDETVLRGYFDKLADGGQVTMPLEKAPWGDTFGMLTDRFGVTWLVNVNQGQQG